MITLEKLKELADKATPGAWKPHKKHSLHEEGPCVDSEHGEYVCSTGTDGTGLGDNDAQFIAASREAVPLLIAEVESLRRALSFYATYSPRLHPEGYYEIHVAPGEGGEVKFGTFARKTLAQSLERLP